MDIKNKVTTNLRVSSKPKKQKPIIKHDKLHLSATVYDKDVLKGFLVQDVTLKRSRSILGKDKPVTVPGHRYISVEEMLRAIKLEEITTLIVSPQGDIVPANNKFKLHHYPQFNYQDIMLAEKYDNVIAATVIRQGIATYSYTTQECVGVDAQGFPIYTTQVHYYDVDGIGIMLYSPGIGLDLESPKLKFLRISKKASKKEFDKLEKMAAVDTYCAEEITVSKIDDRVRIDGSYILCNLSYYRLLEEYGYKLQLFGAIRNSKATSSSNIINAFCKFRMIDKNNRKAVQEMLNNKSSKATTPNIEAYMIKYKIPVERRDAELSRLFSVTKATSMTQLNKEVLAFL